MAEAKKGINTVSLVGLLVGLVLLIAGGVLVGISKLASVSTNPYLSSPDLTSILYGVLFGIGFVVFVSFLSIIYEDRKEQ